MSLALDGFSVDIGRRTVVHDVDAVVPEGRVLALLGRNGAGKTTLVRGLAGLLPTRGAARLDGTDIAALPPGPRSRLAGYVAQDLAGASARLTVMELLLLAQNGGRLSWRATPESLGRAVETMALLRLDRLAGALLAELSGGQRQMVHLALALVRRPRLLLLDEPTSALDLANQLHLLGVVRSYTERERIVTVMILHDLSLAARFADQVLMLQAGRIAFAGATQAVMTGDTISRIYSVSCRVMTVEGTMHQAIYPLDVLGEPLAGP